VPGGYLDPKVIDFCCISDNYYLGKTKPCLTYGLRGCTYFHASIESSSKDLHSGVIGGSVHECTIDLVHLLSKLVDSHGNIKVPGIMDSVRKVTDEELKTYETMDFDLKQYHEDAGINGISDKLLYKTKQEILMHRWRYPTCTIHGIQGAFDGVGSKTVIPRKVIGKFSLRIVPDQTPQEIEGLVIKFMNDEFAKLNSPNKVSIKMDKGGPPWICSTDSPNFVAARKATVRVHGVEPDLTREGGSIPITIVFQECCESDVVLLPIGACDDMAHSQNEKIDRKNFINGMKTFASYLIELSNLDEKAIQEGAKETQKVGKKLKSWRRRCKKDQTIMGCDCLECQ
jgi:nonspecific dipeptidase